MLDNFRSKFTEFSSKKNLQLDLGKVPSTYVELLLAFGGKSFDRGLYTIHTFEDSLIWNDIIPKSFTNFDGKVLSFGHDWMGRQFCIPKTEDKCILMFDSSQQDDFILFESLFEFHDNILGNSKLENLSPDLFEKVMQSLSIQSITYDECLGHKLPLFLNGNDELSNYEKVDLKFYWTSQQQMYDQVKFLPDGTRVSSAGVILDFKPDSRKDN